MAEIAARHKHACPSCGADAQWNAGKQAMVCPYCGTASPAIETPTGVEIVENDLLAALRHLSLAEHGWAVEKKSVRCQACQAISVFDPARVGQRCDFCGSPALIPLEQQTNPIRPESVLEFKLSETEARDLVRKWYGSHWFAPGKLKSRALTDTIHGVYLPYWTFDAQVSADWTAESGHYYYTTEQYRDQQGRIQTRQVRHVRWTPSAGHLEHFFDDELVPASRGVPPALLRGLEPFPTVTDLKPYDPGYLAGWTVEQYQLDLAAAAQNSRQAMEAKLRDLCAAEVPGDTHRSLEVAADYSGQTFKHILVPVWVLAYTYGSARYQVAINGYTGRIAGKYPISWLKVALVILAALVAFAIFALVSQNGG